MANVKAETKDSKSESKTKEETKTEEEAETEEEANEEAKTHSRKSSQAMKGKEVVAMVVHSEPPKKAQILLPTTSGYFRLKYIFEEKLRAERERTPAMEKYTIPEVSSEEEWLYLTGQAEAPPTQVKPSFAALASKQVLLVDVYSSWSGPCVALEGYLRKLRHQFVENPNCLVLAKAQCDDIAELEPFKHDPRPTFLFWALGAGAVALLRGANRPLLTKLVESEVRIETGDDEPRVRVDVDFRSERVIQCQGELCRLADDEIVHSIGSGQTHKLTTFGNEDAAAAAAAAAGESCSATAEGAEDEEEDELQALLRERRKWLESKNTAVTAAADDDNGSEKKTVEDGEDKNGTRDDEEEEDKENGESTEDSPEEAEANEDNETSSDPTATVAAPTNDGFGMKKARRGSKKLETGLLNQIMGGGGDSKSAKR